MLKVGLTGGIASGKSVVGEMFAVLGAKVIRADDIAHELMQPGRPVYQQVVQRFGTGILNPDGVINRARGGGAALGGQDPGAPPRVPELNNLFHPAVIRTQEEWMDE